MKILVEKGILTEKTLMEMGKPKLYKFKELLEVVSFPQV
jgi:hypothetical protein